MGGGGGVQLSLVTITITNTTLSSIQRVKLVRLHHLISLKVH